MKYDKNKYLYLEGPKPRKYELLFAFQVFWEFIRGFRKLHFVGPCITVFGSARFKEGHEYYEQAREVGRQIAKIGMTVMTGGGPGIMEAANRGAFESGGYSVGCNVTLPFEQYPNSYMHKWVQMNHFFVRKTLLLKYSYSFVVMPGGWGTMDELFETLTLVQTAVINNFPVVLIGKKYYEPLIGYFKMMIAEGTIAEKDLDLVLLTDDVTEGIAHIKKYLSDNYKRHKVRKPIWWLFEKI